MSANVCWFPDANDPCHESCLDAEVHCVPGDPTCNACGLKPAEGFAVINDRRYCHGDGDDGRTCYERHVFTAWQMESIASRDEVDS